MAYKTKKDLVDDWIGRTIEYLKSNNKDVDYEKLIAEIQGNVKCSRGIIEQQISNAIHLKKLKEIHILTICDEEIPKFLDNIREREKQVAQEIKEAGL